MTTLKDVAERANVTVATVYQVLTKPEEVTETDYTSVMEAVKGLDYVLNITIRDVAAYAGVSVSTVSYVINNNPLIKPATRQKVREAIRALGYHPNTTARNLKTSETHMIGYAWHVAEDPVRRNPLLDLFLYELAQYAESCGYHILTFTQPPHSGIKAYEELRNTSRVDGFVLSDLVYDDPRVKRLMDMKIPFAAYGHSNEEWDFPYVDVDGQRGIQLVIEHLLSRGHERIGLISWPEGFRIGDVRTEGYFKAIQGAGLTSRDAWIAHTPNTFDHAFDAAHQILSSKPRPTAIVCANDIMAFGAKRYLETLSLEAGTDVALTGYDDTPVAELIGLTSVRQPIGVIASKVVELLLAEIAHQRPIEHQMMLEPSLVVRASSVPSRRR
ncbi:MAG TPA: LacI family DNA-binding transcriptional regulator [Aggregatilineales bacterium]|nr:LacI family DNA-binding transcriptional regulator [Aggregatilineales bacterium]